VGVFSQALQVVAVASGFYVENVNQADVVALAGIEAAFGDRVVEQFCGGDGEFFEDGDFEVIFRMVEGQFDLGDAQHDDDGATGGRFAILDQFCGAGDSEIPDDEFFFRNTLWNLFLFIKSV
jgi:hypothetical protein